MPFEFPHRLNPFVGDTEGHLSFCRHPWDRGKEYGAWLQTIWYWPFHRIHKRLSSDLDILCGMPEIEHLSIEIEAFGERPIVLCTICAKHQFQIRILVR